MLCLSYPNLKSQLLRLSLFLLLHRLTGQSLPAWWVGRNGRQLSPWETWNFKVSIYSNTNYGTVLIAQKKDQRPGVPQCSPWQRLGGLPKMQTIASERHWHWEWARTRQCSWPTMELLARDCQNGENILWLNILPFTPGQHMEVHYCSSARGCSSRGVVRSNTMVKKSTDSVVELQFLLEGRVEGTSSSITFPSPYLLVYW